MTGEKANIEKHQLQLRLTYKEWQHESDSLYEIDIEYIDKDGTKRIEFDLEETTLDLSKKGIMSINLDVLKDSPDIEDEGERK